ncbi:hypothetical protein [Trujillonella humicola]|uniref:hypothetical protein n=1 Tax=Trujillonella humicola TaxID=3383699 RepID=UPI0039066CD2
MSPPRPAPTERLAVPDGEPEKKKISLSPVQVTAGAMASVSSAVVASFFGVAGTLIGAALASVISTVSAALYSTSLARTNDRLRQVRVQLAAPGSPGSPGRTAADTADPAGATAVLDGPADGPDAVARPDDEQDGSEPDDAAAGTRVLPAALDPRRAPAPRATRWPRVAGYAVAIFGLAMGIVTGVEIVSQQPVSALVGAQEASSTTTLGELTRTSSSPAEDPGAPAPTTTPAPATETPGDGTGTGTTAPTTAAPTTPGPTTGTPTEAPPPTGTPTAGPTEGTEAPPTGPSPQPPDGGAAPGGGGGAAPGGAGGIPPAAPAP